MNNLLDDNLIKSANWQFYITRQANLATEHLMHLGFLDFTKKVFGQPVFKRVNVYKNGIADIYVDKQNLEQYKDYLKKLYKEKQLDSLYQDCLEKCQQVEKWLDSFSQIKFKTLTDEELLNIYKEVIEQTKKIAPALILPRLAELALTEKSNWKKDQQIMAILKNYANLNEYRRNLTSRKLYKQWDKLFAEIGQRNDLTLEETLFLLPEEIEQLLNSRTASKKLKSKAKARITGCIYLINNDQVVIEERIKPYKKYFDNLKPDFSGKQKIKGESVCQGKIKSAVRVVQKNDDYKKVRPGEIVVTSMTQPEITEIIDKVAGIITDEGGILCHAAVISREYKIPCLVGTKVATKALINDEEVYLNASAGYFKKVSNSK